MGKYTPLETTPCASWAEQVAWGCRKQALMLLDGLFVTEKGQISSSLRCIPTAAMLSAHLLIFAKGRHTVAGLCEQQFPVAPPKLS